MLRYTLRERLLYIPRIVTRLGRGKRCPFCGWRFSSFLPGGQDSPLFARLKVIPPGRRDNVVCPRCLSNDRERLLYLYLLENTSVFAGSARVLHVAPEPCLAARLRAVPGLRYHTADLTQSGVDFRMDITKIPAPDAVFDAIICNHVLEHVPDDHQAMRELARVLRPGGWAILQVPLAPDLTVTDEEPDLRDPQEQFCRFGQRDHVRIYGRDYVSRLERAGFAVQLNEFAVSLPAEFGVLAEERLFLARKPAS